MKGCVTIYATTGCPYCLQAKQTLQEHGIQYTQVLLDHYSLDVQEWLKERTGKSSVPQIFFNNYHIGGNDELQSAVKDSTKWQNLLGILSESEELSLKIPNSKPSYDESIAFAYEKDPLADIARQFKESEVPRKCRQTLFSSRFISTFSGQEFVKWFCRTEEAEVKEAIVQGILLLKKKFILPCRCQDTEFENSPTKFYRFHDGSNNGSLNAGPEEGWIVPDALVVGECLRRKVLSLYDKHLSSDGKTVDYKSMQSDEDFQHYASFARLLNRVRLEDVRSSDAKKAFFINIYNALVIHATVCRGAPSNMLSRLKFYSKMSYSIGGHVFTLDEIEHGVLRANRRPPLALQPIFSASDPRRSFSVDEIDPRIHFALNCGARSCPPIKTYSAENVDSELQAATEAYLESDEGVRVCDADSKSITNVDVSSLVKWYFKDFGNNKQDVFDWIINNLPDGSKKEALNMLRIHGRWKISYLSYNWDVNSSVS